jgi:hypothetical protein
MIMIGSPPIFWPRFLRSRCREGEPRVQDARRDAGVSRSQFTENKPEEICGRLSTGKKRRTANQAIRPKKKKRNKLRDYRNELLVAP